MNIDRILNLVGLLLVLLLNGLANALPINGYNTGQISEMYPNLFVPAGFTFSIWGVIYLLLIGWVGYFLVPFKKKEAIYEDTKIRKLFFLSCLANSSWILAWHYLNVELSFLIMICILTCLIIIYQRIVHQQFSWIVKVPISVYLGWISVATIANFTALLVDNGITGGDFAHIYAAVMIATSVLLGLLFIFNRKDVFYGGVIVWALFGIYANHEIFLIQLAAMTGIIVLTIGIFYSIMAKNHYPLK